MRKTDSEKQKDILKACRKGVLIRDIAKQVGVATRTVKRILSESQITIKRGRPRREEYLRTRAFDDSSSDDKMRTAVAVLSRTDFPYPTILSLEETTAEVSRVLSAKMRVDGDGVVRPWNIAGVRLCAPFFPDRYRATSKGSVSAFDAWHDEVELARAIAFQIKQGHPVIPRRVLRAITLRCRTPTIFRPTMAKFVFDTFCPRGGTAWDPCAGYGGRLLGAHTSGVHYIGTDVEEATIAGNRSLAAAVGARAELFHQRAETFSPPAVDLVFTSPPYFDRERYSLNEEQSWRKHGASLDAWVEGFLRPIIERAGDALADGRHLVLNVANLRAKGKIVPLVERTIETAIALKFRHVTTFQMPLAAINRKSPSEPILIFTKT